MPDVIVIGAGPVGLLISAELRRLGAEVTLLEQRPQPGPGSRAIGIHSPALAALEASGLTARILDQALRVRAGQAQVQGRVLGTVRFDALNRRFPFVATLPQESTEEALSAVAPPPERGATVHQLRPRHDGVIVCTDSGERSAPLVVLAGGARSRRLVFAEPEAHHYPDRYLMTDAHVGESSDETTAVIHLEARGVLESFPLPGRRRRFVAWDPPNSSPDPAARAARMADALQGQAEDEAVQVREFGVRRFIAPRMRNNRLFVIGDAAHEVSPIGGQGMNLGLLDAASLAPPLAQWARTGSAPEAELQTWERTRLRSARRAAALAGVNTRLGRSASPLTHHARQGLVTAMLGPGARRLFTHAYAMGLDLDA
ncbi:FAD-dependent oxidoreductase [Nesterenkonia populi]|uniref:FAD-dependent oxidoreductase n=1 Tax=Nesterenkonia populi TaxID=1591087 RepID=UPI0011BF405D|nr:NAD(P)/FAD-dependent oxidoreductase [Nesterenkonia populi]